MRLGGASREWSRVCQSRSDWVGVGGSEAGDGGVEAGGGADVAGDHAGVAGAGVAAGEGFAADGGVFEQGGGLELVELDGGLVVVELADEEVAALDGGPAEEGVGLELHGALAVDDAAALMRLGGHIAEIWGVGRERLFLDLQKERVLGAVALHVDAVVAQADRAGADDLEGDVERGVLGEEVAALRLEGFGVGGERVEDRAGKIAMDAGEDWVDGFEDAYAGLWLGVLRW